MFQNLFRFITPGIYWLLVISWMYIFIFYFRRINKKKYLDKMLSTLFIILSIDAFRTLLESSYFGVWYTSLSGIINIKYYNFLAQPEIVFIPKILNLSASFLIIFILIRKWIPEESHRLSNFKNKIRNIQFIINQIPVSIVITDLQGNIEFVNEQFYSLTGYTSIEVIGNNPRILNSEEKSVTDYQVLWNTISRGNQWQGHFYNKKKNGDFYWENATITPLSDEDGVILNYLAIKEDVTDKVLLDNEKEVLLAAIEQSSDVVEIVDAEGKIQYVNKMFTKTTGYSKEDAIGKKPLDLFWDNKNQNNILNDELWEQLKAGKSGKVRFKNRIKDGNYIVEEVSIAPVFDKNGIVRNYSSVKRNITKQIEIEEKQRMIQEQLYQTQKSEAVGQLAGGTAHDFNNILTSIISAATLLQNKESHLDEKSSHYLDMILTSAQRASVLASNLLSISRRGQMKSSHFHINKVLIETIQLLKSTISKNIEVISLFQNEKDIVLGDESVFQNLLLNIGINASHAISNFGTIEFCVENVFINDDYCHNSSFNLSPGEHCKIEISDTGCGISEDILPKIFDAFFTTKRANHGTGLGLSTVIRYMHDYNGEIKVHSIVDQGTVFSLLLPCSENQLSTELILDQSISSGIGQILLVDDEEFNRELGKEILESLGYTVLLASDGNEAIQVYSEKIEKIDLIVMDMIMPKMDGSEAYIKIKEIHPDAKIVIATGNSENTKIKELKSIGLKYLISKPYGLVEFSRLIKKVLND